MASLPATILWRSSDTTREMHTQKPSLHRGDDFSVLFSALLLATAMDEGDFPLQKESLDSFFGAAHHSAALKSGFEGAISAVLSCIAGLHGGEIPRAPSADSGLRSSSSWHISLRNVSNGLLARASSVALQHRDEEPGLCALLPDVVRVLFTQLSGEGPTEQDSSFQQCASRLLAWLSRHAPAPPDTVLPESAFAVSEAESEGSLLATLGEAVGEFTFFGVEALHAPSCVDARLVPKSMLRGAMRNTGDVDDDSTVVVRATHVLQIGPPASDTVALPTQYMLWTLFINWTHMLIIKVSSGRSGPPVSVNVLLALADLTRQELEMVTASTPPDTGYASTSDAAVAEAQLMAAAIRSDTLAEAEQDAVRDYCVLPFAGADGLLAVLRVLSARASPHALGVCGGVRLDNPAAIERAVRNGVPPPDSPLFGAGLFLSSGHYIGRTHNTSFTVEDRWSEDPPERRRGAAANVADDSGRRSCGLQRFLRSVACPGVLYGGSRCEHCVAVFDSARKLKAESAPGIFADVDAFTSPPARAGGVGASPAVSTAAAFSRSPLAARRKAEFYKDASAATLRGEIAVLLAAYRKNRDALRDHIAAFPDVHKNAEFVSLPEEEQDAVAHVVQYHDPTDVSMRLSSPYVSKEFATVIRWWFELMKLYRRTGTARKRIQYPVAVVEFCLSLYNRDTAMYSLLRTHMHYPCPATLKKYTALPNADGTDSPHAIYSMIQFVLRFGFGPHVFLTADEIYLQENQSVSGGATTRSNVINLAPQHTTCALTTGGVADPVDGPTAAAVNVTSVGPAAAPGAAPASAAPQAPKQKKQQKNSIKPGVAAAFISEAARVQAQAASAATAGCDSDDSDEEDDSAPHVKQIMGLTIGAVDPNTGKLMPMFYCPVESMRATSVYVLVRRALWILALLGLVSGLLMTDGAQHFGRYGTLLADVAWYGNVMPTINGIVCGEPNPFLGLSGMPLLICKDPEHFLKLFWMALTRSGLDRKLGLRILWYMGAALPMELFDELLKLDSAEEAGAAATAHFLTELAVNPKGGAAMRPHLAKQFLDAGAGCLLPALSGAYADKPRPMRRALVAMARVCAELGKAVEAVMSRSIIRGCPSKDASEADVLHDSRQYTLPGGPKCQGKVRSSAQKTREHCLYVPDAMSAVCERLCAETVYPGSAASSTAALPAAVSAATAALPAAVSAATAALPAAVSAATAAAAVAPMSQVPAMPLTAAELAVKGLAVHPLTRATRGGAFLRGWQERAAAENSRLAGFQKAALAKIASLARRPRAAGYVPRCLGGPLVDVGRRISVICVTNGKRVRRFRQRTTAVADDDEVPSGDAVPDDSVQVGQKRRRAAAASAPSVDVSAPSAGAADVAAPTVAAPTVAAPTVAAPAAKLVKQSPKPRTVKLPSLNNQDRGPSRQSISDYIKTMCAMTFLVWCSVDCPNRLTTMVRRFCHANGLPVILLPWFKAATGAAAGVLPLDAFDDALLCRALADVDINFMMLVTDDEGVPSPVMLSAEDATRARLEIEAAAQQMQQVTIPAPAPRSLTGLTEDEIASLRSLKLGMYHSTYLENFFAMLRGGTLIRGGGYGSIPSDAMPRTFGQGQSVLLNGSGRGTILGGESFHPAAAPPPMVWRTGAVGAPRLNSTGADTTAVALLPLAVPTISGGSSSGQQTVRSSFGGNVSP